MRLGRDVVARDLYALLGVRCDSTAHAIRTAYRRQIRRSHPDVMRAEHALAEKRTVELNLAAFVLLDPLRRAAYDRARREPSVSSRAVQPDRHYHWTAEELGRDPVVRSFLRAARTAPATTCHRLTHFFQTRTPRFAVTMTATCVLVFVTVVSAFGSRSLPLPNDQRERARVTIW
jgi:curved DNA-binding protein CbpA